MPVTIEPPELAQVVDFAARPRAGGWSLRSACVRYGQPEPQRVTALMEVVRRLDVVLHRDAKLLERDGPALWRAATGDGATAAPKALADTVELVRVLIDLDALGDVLAEWATDITADRPNARVDEVVRDVEARIDALGVPREDPAVRRPRGRG